MKYNTCSQPKPTLQQVIDLISSPTQTDALLSGDNIEAIVEVSKLAYSLYVQGDHIACSFLCRAAKKRAVREALMQTINEDKELPISMLQSENPKMRKNTARLMGALKDESFVQALSDALCNERVRMCIPSIILALGAIGGKNARNVLLEYEVAPAADDFEQKHEREERDALSKVLSTFETGFRHEFTDFSALSVLQLVCASEMTMYIADELRCADIKVLSYSDTTIDICESDVKKIYSVRSFRELLIPLCKKGEAHDGMKDKLVEVLNSVHKPSDKPFRYRIEYRGTESRRESISDVVKLLECQELVNSVSDYEVEVRVYDDMSVKVKLYTYHDNRFLYRKCAIPASINPANAASVMSFAKRYMKEDAVVLDMCCGSGTMLFEREKCRPCKRLMGVDISAKAIDAAKTNAKAFGTQALFYQTDCKRFTLREKADEVISNLPFGNRVGTHENNEELYINIFNNMDNWLKVGGIAVLYTMEYNLLKSVYERSNEFELVDMRRTEAGGLFPTITILKKVK